MMTELLHDPGLSRSDPLRAGAAYRLINISWETPERAAEYATAAGMPFPPCWAVGSPERRTVPTRNQFPNEAQRWGFEGWVTSQLAIRDNGEIQTSTPFAAYPPFIFRPATERVLDRTRFVSGTTCSRPLTVRFRLE